MKYPLYISFIIALLSQSSLALADQHVHSSIITRDDYCSFLQQNAASDPHHLFEAANKEIILLGIPGSLDYAVARGGETSEPRDSQAAIMLSTLDVACYCNAEYHRAYPKTSQEEPTEHGPYEIEQDHILFTNQESSFTCFLFHASRADHIDPLLKSNLITFALAENPNYKEAGVEEAIAVMNPEDLEALAALCGMLASQGFMRQPSLNHGALEERIERNSNQSARSSRLNGPSRTTPDHDLVHNLLERSHHLTLPDHSIYEDADHAWKSREAGWAEQSNLHYLLAEHKTEEAIAKEQLDQATAANTHEARNETRLGKITKILGAYGGHIGYIPEPNMQIASIGVQGGVMLVDAIHGIYTQRNENFARAAYETCVQKKETAAEAAMKANLQLINLEQSAYEAENVAATRAQQHSQYLASLLKPHAANGAAEWRTWGREFFHILTGAEEETEGFLNVGKPKQTKGFSEHQFQTFLRLVQSQASDPSNQGDFKTIETLGSTLWKERINNSKKQLATLESSLNPRRRDINLLQKAKSKTQVDLQQAAIATKRSFDQLTTARNSFNILQEQIDQFCDQQNEGKTLSEQARTTFVSNLTSLVNIQRDLEQLKPQWEKDLNTEHQLHFRLDQQSSILASQEQQQQRLVTRYNTLLEKDRALLRYYWPDQDPLMKPFSEWKTPGKIPLNQNIPQEIIAPSTTLAEAMAQGKERWLEVERRLQEQLSREGEKAPHDPAYSEPSPLRKNDNIIFPLPEKREEVAGQQDEKDQADQADQAEQTQEPRDIILTYLCSQAETQPGAQLSPEDQERLDLYKQIQQLEDTSNRLIRELQRSSSSTSSDTDDLQTPTQSSPQGETKKNSSEKNNPEQRSKEIEAELSKLEEERMPLMEEYADLVQRAEEQRLSSGGAPFASDEITEEAWEEADRILLDHQEEQEQRTLEQEKLSLETQNWEENNSRWEALLAASEAAATYSAALQAKQTASQHLEREAGTQRLRMLAKNRALAPWSEAVMKALDKKKESEERWEELAKEHLASSSLARPAESIAGSLSNILDFRNHSSEHKKEEVSPQALEQLKASDMAVVERWKQLYTDHTRKAMSYTNTTETQPQESTSESISAETELYCELDQLALSLHHEVKNAQEREKQKRGSLLFPQKANSTSGTTEAIDPYATYQAHIQELALRTARENRPNMPQAWANRIEGNSRLAAIGGKGARVVESAKKSLEATGFEIFQKEQTRLTHIEHLFQSILEEQEKRTLEKATRAAGLYEQGQPETWNNLLPEERHLYIMKDTREEQERRRKIDEQSLILDQIAAYLREQEAASNQNEAEGNQVKQRGPISSALRSLVGKLGKLGGLGKRSSASATSSNMAGAAEPTFTGEDYTRARHAYNRSLRMHSVGLGRDPIKVEKQIAEAVKKERKEYYQGKIIELDDLRSKIEEERKLKEKSPPSDQAASKEGKEGSEEQKNLKERLDVYLYARNCYRKMLEVEGNLEHAAIDPEAATNQADGWRKAAQYFQQAAEALAQGDQEKVISYKELAHVYGGGERNPGAGSCYKKMFEALSAPYTEEVREELAQYWKEAAKALLKKGEALEKGDKKEAMEYHFLFSAAGGHENCPGIAYTLEQREKARASGNKDLVKIYENLLEVDYRYVDAARRKDKETMRECLRVSNAYVDLIAKQRPVHG